MKKLFTFIWILSLLVSLSAKSQNPFSFNLNGKEKKHTDTQDDSKSSQIGKPQFETHFQKINPDTNWVLDGYELNTYNSLGLLDIKTYQNSSGHNTMRILYFYNKFGSDTASITQNYDSLTYNWTNATKDVKKRDFKNNITENSFYYWNSTNWQLSIINSQNIYVYNSQDFIIEKIAKSFNSFTGQLEFDYKLQRTYVGKNLTLEILSEYETSSTSWLLKNKWICFYDTQNALIGYTEQAYVGGTWRNHQKWENMVFSQNNSIDWGKDYDEEDFFYYANKIQSLNINLWDTLSNTWKYESRMTVTWNNFNGYEAFGEVYRNSQWKNDYIYTEGYDQYSNWLGYSIQSWEDSIWVYNEYTSNTYTYNPDKTIAKKIYESYEDNEGTTTEEHLRVDYNNYMFFQCNAKFTCNSSTTTVNFTDQSSGNGQTCYWQFGDGQSSRLRNPLHTYPNTGFYRVSLSIYNPITECFDKKDTIIAVGNPWNDCQALFTYVDAGSNLATFTNISLGVGINNYLWNFGDGQTSVIQTPSHTYTNAGFYDVCLTISSANGCVNTYCRQIALNNGGTDFLPYFSYAVDSADAKGKQSVSYKGAAYGDPAKANYNIDWNFGDGSTASSSFNTTHQYDNEGVYLVTLKLTGATKTRFCVDLINISPSQTTLKGGFGYLLDTTSKANSYPVSYKGAAFGDPARISWSFGDGTIDTTTMYPTHIYADTGMYNVCLTLSDPITGQSNTNCNLVRVGSLVNVKNYKQLNSEIIDIYPNPTTGNFKIAFNNDKSGLVCIDLYDNLGILKGSILKKQLLQGEFFFDFDLSYLKNGLYFLKYYSANQSKVIKLMKQ